ncbi:MAG: hypothetical protein H0T42_21955 [Deltaproteobacteria bacterium]|nr:hypothetical protein [Deltaproteobacteria bacterium]
MATRRAAFLEDLFQSASNLRRCEAQLQDMLRSRGILFGDGLLPTYAYAFIAGRGQIQRWAGQAELLIAAAEHLSRRLVAEPEFYRSMGLGRDAIELISVDPGYQRGCVLCRPDGIPSGADLKFVELNCDSPAMMMFLDIVAECLFEMDAFASFRAEARPASAADMLLETLLACYAEYGGRDKAPTIAIVDWEAQKTRYEHMRLAEHFEARGAPTIVCDPRAFQLVDGELRINGRRVDLVYRRTLASEIIARQTEVEPLLRAYRDGKVCMVNPMRSYLAGVKSVLSQIAMSRDLPLALSGAANLVPRTLLLDNQDARDTVKESPTRWALKKSESHAGMNVILPGVSTQSAWADAMEASRREVWIAQEYLEVPTMELPEVEGESVAWNHKYYNWNPFVFGGRYAGGLVRVSSTPLINITLGGGLMPTFTKEP